MQEEIAPVNQAHAYGTASDPLDFAPNVGFRKIRGQANGKARQNHKRPIIERIHGSRYF